LQCVASASVRDISTFFISL